MTDKEINQKIIAILFPAYSGTFGISDLLLKCADFCTDLDAMWYAECKLEWDEVEPYSQALRMVTHGGDYVAHMDRRFHATARDRAITFVEVKKQMAEKRANG